MTATVKGLLTVADWAAIPRGDGPCFELVEGVLVQMPDDASPRHDYAALNLCFWLRELLSEDEWLVFPNRGVELWGEPRATVRIADVLVVSRSAYDRKETKGTFVVEETLLAVEFVSDDSTAIDRRDKRREYEKAGVAHYWIFDTRDNSRGERVTVLQLVDGHYVEQPAMQEDGRVVIAEPVALDFRLEDLGPRRRS